MEDDKLYVDLNGAHNCGLFNQTGEVKAEYQYEPWIDVAKAVCIGGVVLQHVRGYVYTNDKIFYSVWFVVALFVLIGGYNAMASYRRHGYFSLKQKLIGILVPYVFATIIYRCYELRFFDAEDILNHLIHFDACGPMYYVAAYVQLLLVTPFLISLVLWCHEGKYILKYLLVSTSVILVCYITVHYTNIFDIIIGGGDLFAGPWLMFWFAGMCVYDLNLLRLCDEYRFSVAIASTAILIAWQWIFVEKEYNLILKPIFYGDQVGMTWANSFQVIVLLFWFKSVSYIIEDHYKQNRIVKYCLSFISFLGRHSLYIFMYHILFRSIYISLWGNGAYINKITCLVFIIMTPVLLEYFIIVCKKVFGNQLPSAQIR